jgi:hypothetical protein
MTLYINSDEIDGMCASAGKKMANDPFFIGSTRRAHQQKTSHQVLSSTLHTVFHSDSRIPIL